MERMRGMLNGWGWSFRMRNRRWERERSGFYFEIGVQLGAPNCVRSNEVLIQRDGVPGEFVSADVELGKAAAKRYAERLAVAGGHVGSERSEAEDSEAGQASLPGASIAERTGRRRKQFATWRRASLLSEEQAHPGSESGTGSLPPGTALCMPEEAPAGGIPGVEKLKTARVRKSREIPQETKAALVAEGQAKKWGTIEGGAVGESSAL